MINGFEYVRSVTTSISLSPTYRPTYYVPMSAERDEFGINKISNKVDVPPSIIYKMYVEAKLL